MVPWLVPENSLFSVRDLPDGLKKLADKLALRYIWIDLLCIPQNGSEQASTEISRQVEIFGGARTVVAWLNTMRSWKVLRESISWMLLRPLVPDRAGIDFRMNVQTPSFPFWMPFLNFLHSPGTLLVRWRFFFSTKGRIKRRFNRLEKRLLSRAPPVPPGGPDHISAIEYGWDDDSNAADMGFITFHWFSSLWTLQESTLRPDMLLANRGWELFKIASKVPVALDTITQLCCLSAWKSSPIPVTWLMAMIYRSGICLNRDEKPLHALAIGTIRSCTSRRSEAIMSLLGCVEWHRKDVAERQSSTRPSSDLNGRHLFLDLYEYEFILEVRQKYGFIFFSSQCVSYPFFFEVLERRKPLGTILPFPARSQHRNARHTMKFIPRYVTEWCHPHPSVDTWELLPDGSVKMSKVGILYSTPDANRGGIWESLFRDRYDIKAPNDRLPLNSLKEADLVKSHMPLGKWMDTHWTNFSKYAVVVSWSGSPFEMIAGFILAEVEIDGSCSAKHLAKLADFQCIHKDFTLSELPRITEVDWIIY